MYARVIGCGVYLVLMGLLGAGPRQMIVAVAEDNTTHIAPLRLLSRSLNNGPWRADSDFIPVLLGRSGLAWGIGLHPPQLGLQKMEKDGKTPAGIFRIGLVLGAAAHLPPRSKWNRYHQITSNDAWPDDPAVPEYNQLVTLRPGQPVPSWFEKHRMRLNDNAYRWLVVIEHNYPHPVPNHGSAIFFHIRRGSDVPSAGCTVMEEESLEHIISWINPEADPQFVILTKADYLRLWKDWDLPEPGLVCK